MTNKEAIKIIREWGRRGFPMVVKEGYTPTQKGSRYIIYQWNVHGFLFHANFFYRV